MKMGASSALRNVRSLYGHGGPKEKGGKDSRSFPEGDLCRRVREDAGKERGRFKCEGATDAGDWLTCEKRDQEGER